MKRLLTPKYAGGMCLISAGVYYTLRSRHEIPLPHNVNLCDKIHNTPKQILQEVFKFQGIVVRPKNSIEVSRAVASIKEQIGWKGLTNGKNSFDCFIGYRTEFDAEFAVALCTALTEAGYHPYLDQINLRLGDPWQNQLKDAMASSKVFVPILSSRSMSRVINSNANHLSDNVLLELQRAIDIQKAQPAFKIIPIMKDNDAVLRMEYPDKILNCQNTELSKIWSVAGVAGVGKSTLFNMLTGKERQTSNGAVSCTTVIDGMKDMAHPVVATRIFHDGNVKVCDTVGVGGAIEVKSGAKPDDLAKLRAETTIQNLRMVVGRAVWGFNGLIICLRPFERLTVEDQGLILSVLEINPQAQVILCYTRYDAYLNGGRTKVDVDRWINENFRDTVSILGLQDRNVEKCKISCVLKDINELVILMGRDRIPDEVLDQARKYRSLPPMSDDISEGGVNELDATVKNTLEMLKIKRFWRAVYGALPVIGPLKSMWELISGTYADD